MRLDKLLAHAGYGTRKEVKQLIRKKMIQVNGEIVKKDDIKVDEKTDEIYVGDELVQYEQYVYYMLNKPQGVISATVDNKLSTVMDLFDEFVPMDAFPVGRLDIDTEGLLLISNDGDLAHQLLSPKKHVDKVYHVECQNEISDQDIKQLCQGVSIGEGELVSASHVSRVSENCIELTIHEGKFHQVKRMLHAVDNEVIYLKRLRMGSLILDESLQPGEYRRLSDEEIEALKEGQK